MLLIAFRLSMVVCATCVLSNPALWRKTPPGTAGDGDVSVRRYCGRQRVPIRGGRIRRDS